MICYVLAMGKRHLGPHVVVGYGIKIFCPGLFITSPDHLEKTTLTSPTFFDFKSFFLPDSTRFEHIRKFYRRKLKKFEIKAKQTSKNGDV